MSFRFVCFLLSFCAVLSSLSQEVFSCVKDTAYSIRITEEIQFGRNITAKGDSVDLLMDVYSPVSVVQVNRPVVVLAFGGAFLFGERSDLHTLCKSIASQGYVVTTIDYRLFDAGDFPDETESKDATIKGIADMKGAIRYLVNDAKGLNEYGIDPDKIIVGGVSSGAIIANHVAYLQEEDVVIGSDLDSLVTINGGIDGNTNSLPNYESTSVKGVISLSGAVFDVDIIDDNDGVAFFGVHERFDSVVPFDTGVAKVFNIPFARVEGGGAIKNQVDSLALEYTFVTIETDNHTSYLLDKDTTLVKQEFIGFLESLFCEDVTATNRIDENLEGVYVYPNPVQDWLTIKIEEVDLLNSSIEILSVHGLIITQFDQSATVNNVSVNNLSKGVYFISVTNENGEQIRRRFVKE